MVSTGVSGVFRNRFYIGGTLRKHSTMSDIVSPDIRRLSLEDVPAERTSPAEAAVPRKSIQQKPEKNKSFVARFLCRVGKQQGAPDDLPASLLEKVALAGAVARRFVKGGRRPYNSSLYAVSASIEEE